MKEITHLIKDNGEPYESSEISAFNTTLDSLEDIDREKYRTRNALAIAEHNAERMLIVSGPGTGKSHLFLERINYWYKQDLSAELLVTSFVSKLVADLKSDINNDVKLTEEQRKRISVSTLHKLARSIVEKNHGTSECQFKPNVEIIDNNWIEKIYKDVINLNSLNSNTFEINAFKNQFYNSIFYEGAEWKRINDTYFRLCRFYNAMGFADLIIRAKDALKENSGLYNSDYLIIDEYQDFNRAEEELILEMTKKQQKGILIVGDDDQVLYEKLKSSKPDLIRSLYCDKNYVKSMLPFCGRSTFHITKTAAHFIKQHKAEGSIEKIYLPIVADEKGEKTNIIACAHPASVVDYIEKFITKHKCEIDLRQERLKSGSDKDAFLLILTPQKELKFYKN